MKILTGLLLLVVAYVLLGLGSVHLLEAANAHLQSKIDRGIATKRKVRHDLAVAAYIVQQDNLNSRNK